MANRASAKKRIRTIPKRAVIIFSRRKNRVPNRSGGTLQAKIPFCLSAFLWLCLPARLLAYPADSLLVVQVTEFSASGDTDEVEKYEYSRDNQGMKEG
jgi:hypothetical protein